MNAVDATSRAETTAHTEPPSLLTIILDTNPHAWALISSSLPLSKALASLLVFINAHLAINPANRVAVLASHVDQAVWLYPTPHKAHPEEDDRPPDDANKYRPFAHVEHAITTNLRSLMRQTTPSSLHGATSGMIAGALTRALTHISKQIAATNTGPASTQSTFNYSDPSSLPGSNNLSDQASATGSTALAPRILLVSLSGNAPDQYIPLMNTIFASQRLGIPLDILPLTASNNAFLQQAADATHGIYLPLTTPAAHAGLLQYLMFAYLPDTAARHHLVAPGADAGVDFRAACFCHRRIVDLGFVCSICLSIFCEPVLDQGRCLTCASYLSLGEYGRKPAVVPKKKKKKRIAGEAGDGNETPASRAATPAGV